MQSASPGEVLAARCAALQVCPARPADPGSVRVSAPQRRERSRQMEKTTRNVKRLGATPFRSVRSIPSTALLAVNSQIPPHRLSPGTNRPRRTSSTLAFRLVALLRVACVPKDSNDRRTPSAQPKQDCGRTCIRDAHWGLTSRCEYGHLSRPKREFDHLH